MLTKKLVLAAIFATAAVSTTALANDNGLSTAFGAIAGAAIGHHVGGRDGALVGGVLGAVVGASVHDGNERVYYDQPQTYYRPAPVYYGAAPVYYESAPTYYRSAPVIYSRSTVYVGSSYRDKQYRHRGHHDRHGHGRRYD